MRLNIIIQLLDSIGHNINHFMVLKVVINKMLFKQSTKKPKNHGIVVFRNPSIPIYKFLLPIYSGYRENESLLRVLSM